MLRVILKQILCVFCIFVLFFVLLISILKVHIHWFSLIQIHFVLFSLFFFFVDLSSMCSYLISIYISILIFSIGFPFSNANSSPFSIATNGISIYYVYIYEIHIEFWVKSSIINNKIMKIFCLKSSLWIWFVIALCKKKSSIFFFIWTHKWRILLINDNKKVSKFAIKFGIPSTFYLKHCCFCASDEYSLLFSFIYLFFIFLFWRCPSHALPVCITFFFEWFNFTYIFCFWVCKEFVLCSWFFFFSLLFGLFNRIAFDRQRFR